MLVQANFNTQSGQTYYGTDRSYYATAYSNEVQVWSYGNISAGGDGIDAESKAVAVAKVDQGVDDQDEGTAQEPATDEQAATPEEQAAEGDQQAAEADDQGSIRITPTAKMRT